MSSKAVLCPVINCCTWSVCVWGGTGLRKSPDLCWASGRVWELGKLSTYLEFQERWQDTLSGQEQVKSPGSSELEFSPCSHVTWGNDVTTQTQFPHL